MFDSYNMESTIREGIDTQEMEFVPLSNFIGDTVKVDGFFFTNGEYGKQVVVVGNGYKINMPKRCTKQFEKIMSNKLELAAVLTGHLALTDIKACSTKQGETTIFKYTEV